MKGSGYKEKVSDESLINLIETGLKTMTGGRLKRLSKFFNHNINANFFGNLFSRFPSKSTFFRIN